MREVLKPKTPMDWLDKAIQTISPSWGLKRMQARAASNVMAQFNRKARRTFEANYRGAEKNRLRADWLPGGGSADTDLLSDLPTLRHRSRDLNRNSAHAAAITQTVCVNVIGSGMKPQSRVDRETLGIDESDARIFERQAEREWKRFVPFADSGNRMDFWEIQALIQRQILENGEVLVLPIRIKDEPWRPYNLALEIIEADRLATPPSGTSNANIRDGVELGERGQPVAYWIRKQHPGDTGFRVKKSQDFIRYPARNPLSGKQNIFHLYHVKRAGQSRGEPFFAPVMTAFKDLADYIEATEVAARVAACFAGFITKEQPFEDVNINADATNALGQREQELEPGMLERLAPGESITFANPQRVDSAFEPFVLAMLRSIGAALGLPLELVLKDFSRTNYSSARAALLEARRFFKYYQQWMASRLCQPVWEMVVEEAWLRGRIPSVNILGDERAAWMQARWIAPGWGWVDPKKEIEASMMAVDGNLSTLADENAAQGRDWEDTIDQRAREQQKIKDAGLVMDAPEPSQAVPEPEEEETNEEVRV